MCVNIIIITIQLLCYFQAFWLLYFKSTPSLRSVFVRKLVSCKVTENPFSYVYLELLNLEIE